MDMRKYLQLYLAETREHLAAFDEELSLLLQSPEERRIIGELFRRAHSIKGMSASMGFAPITEVAHSIEDAIERLQKREAALTPELFDAIAHAMDGVRGLVVAVERGEPLTEDLSGWLLPLSRASQQATLPPQAEPPKPDKPAKNTPAVSEPHSRFIIQFSAEAQMPAARAVVALRRLESFGTLLESEPPLSELRRGDFRGRLIAVLRTSESTDLIRSELERVTDVESVEVHPPAGRAAGPPPQAGAQSPEGSKPQAGASRTTPDDPGPQTLRIRTESLDRFLEAIGELVVHRGRLARMLEPVADPATREEFNRLRKVVDDLFREVMGMRMLPFDTIAYRLVRSARELGRELSRPITLDIKGRQVRLDRAMLDELVDPINHILRNCIGHGIEDHKERAAAGKPETGLITINLQRRGDGVTIRIDDDGRGMDPQKIREHALERRFITPEQAELLSDTDSLMLTTIPGFSTAEAVTELSGRGIGMDVVRTKVESLGGRLVIRSRPGEGTCFELRVPLTIAIIRAFLVRSAGKVWAVPLTSVRKTAELMPGALQRLSEGAVVSIGEETVELYDLASAITGVPSKAARGLPRPALIVGLDNRTVGFIVDSVLGQSEIVVRPLGPPLDELREYSGATVLEDGQIALILDLHNLASSQPEMVR
jgi:two-component system chemotaxis sensor kinase CheA